MNKSIVLLKFMIIFVTETKTKTNIMWRYADNSDNYKRLKALAPKLEELILEAHFWMNSLDHLYARVDECVELWIMTPNEAKTLKNEKMMIELANEIYG